MVTHFEDTKITMERGIWGKERESVTMGSKANQMSDWSLSYTGHEDSCTCANKMDRYDIKHLANGSWISYCPD